MIHRYVAARGIGFASPDEMVIASLDTGRIVENATAKAALLTIAEAAETMAKCTGSIGARQTETIFGQEVSVTFEREGLNFSDAVFTARKLVQGGTP